jgi:hypothetical protein
MPRHSNRSRPAVSAAIALLAMVAQGAGAGDAIGRDREIDHNATGPLAIDCSAHHGTMPDCMGSDEPATAEGGRLTDMNNRIVIAGTTITAGPA